MQKSLLQFSLFLVFTMILTACTVNENGQLVIQLVGTEAEAPVLEALGGAEMITGIDTMSFSVTGEFIEFLQGGRTMDLLNNRPETFSYNLMTELNQRNLRLDWQHTFMYPASYEGESTTIISDQTGSIEGAYDFGSRFFGADAPVPLYSSRIEAILKTQMMGNPLELLRHVITSQGAEVQPQDNTFTISIGDNVPTIELIIDPETSLPSSARTMEVDFLLGDVFFEVKYEDWVKVGDTQYPSRLTYHLGDYVIRMETISDVALNPTLASDSFTVVASGPYDVEYARYGILSSQWYHRIASYGFLRDGPVTETNIENVGENVYMITSPESGCYSLAIDTADGLIIAEPCMHQIRSREVIAAVEAEFPDKEIIGIFTTHHHMDHFGGIRTYAEKTGKIYIGASAVPFVEEVLNGTHALLPDNLANNPRDVDIVGISAITTIGEGSEAFEIHPIGRGHSDDMLGIYFPNIKALFISDIAVSGGIIYGWDIYTPAMQEDFVERAKLVSEYINDNNLEVETLLSVHLGVYPASELQDIIAK